MRNGDIRVVNARGTVEHPILHTWGFSYTQEFIDLPGVYTNLHLTRVITFTIWYSVIARSEAAWVTVDDGLIIINRRNTLSAPRRLNLEAITSVENLSRTSSVDSCWEDADEL